MRFSQQLHGKLTAFLLRHFKDKPKPAYWLEEIDKARAVISESKSALELKIAMNDYLKKMKIQFWMIFPGSRFRNYCKSLQQVLDDPDFSDKRIVRIMGEEEKRSTQKKIRKIRGELKDTIRMVKKECGILRKELDEQKAEVSRLSVENRLLIDALVALNEKHEKYVNENNAEELLDEISSLKSTNEGLSTQNQKLIKIISIIMKCSTTKVTGLVTESDDTPGLLVLKLQRLSAKDSVQSDVLLTGKFFKEMNFAREHDVAGDTNQNSTECC